MDHGFTSMPPHRTDGIAALPECPPHTACWQRAIAGKSHERQYSSPFARSSLGYRLAPIAAENAHSSYPCQSQETRLPTGLAISEHTALSTTSTSGGNIARRYWPFGTSCDRETHDITLPEVGQIVGLARLSVLRVNETYPCQLACCKRSMSFTLNDVRLGRLGTTRFFYGCRFLGVVDGHSVGRATGRNLTPAR